MFYVVKVGENYVKDKRSGYTESLYKAKLYKSISAVKNSLGHIVTTVVDYNIFREKRNSLYTRINKLKHSSVLKDMFTVLELDDHLNTVREVDLKCKDESMCVIRSYYAEADESGERKWKTSLVSFLTGEVLALF
jgi:hypothetical protein